MNQLTLKELIKTHHVMMLEQGFHDPRLSDLELLTLIITEISEAINAYRRDDWFRHKNDVGFVLINEDIYELKRPFLIGDALEIGNDGFFFHVYGSHIKDTVEDELAGACLRILDFMGLHGINPPEAISLNNVRDDCFGAIEEIISGFNDCYQSEELRWEKDPVEIFKEEKTETFLEKCGMTTKILINSIRGQQYQVCKDDAEQYIIEDITVSLSCILHIAHENRIDIGNHILAAMRFNGTRPKKHDKLF